MSQINDGEWLVINFVEATRVKYNIMYIQSRKSQDILTLYYLDRLHTELLKRNGFVTQITNQSLSSRYTRVIKRNAADGSTGY